MKTLIVAEKPSVGRDIARVLKCGQRGDGFLQSEKHVVTWAIGHLVTLNEPEDYDPSLKKWRRSDLPILPETMGLKALPKTKKQLLLLKKLMNSNETETIICATDSGREGELIFRCIYKWAGCKKPVKRLWISSLTDAAISDGLAKVKDSAEYDNLYASARCRAEADWLVGMNATRAFTLSCNELLPMGRVQTPTLAMLVNRHLEIKAFKPMDYWEVKAGFSPGYTGTWINTSNKESDERVYSREEADAVVEKIKESTGVIESVETEEKRRTPPQLFDLTELQRECNRKLGFSAKKTLETAQALYERHKLITYPRTDSRYLSDDISPKLRGIIGAAAFGEYKNFADGLLALPSLPVTSRIVNNTKVTDHHAIIPTGKKPPASLSADETAVYDRILRNFLAAFHTPHVYAATTVITRVICGAEKDEIFRSKGKTEISAGWTALYSHEKPAKPENSKEPADAQLPVLSKGEQVTVLSAEVLSKKTKPPVPHTEATLLSAMENVGRLAEDESIKEALKSSGLGTPATRAAIIEKLISSGYAQRVKKNLNPTEKGIKLIEIVPPEMRSPETTGKWERALTRIASGKMDESRFMESIRRYVVYLVQQAAHRIRAVKG
ncbi:MAG: DNA topoisomerase 3 [Defluviitaleaceae bacterium]|nr:DNA topoisomerase 3 [Defluviitaleaceae bacterium]